MPISFNQIANNSAKVTFRYGDDPITIEYYPGRVTEKTFAQLNMFASVNETSLETSFEAFNEVLSSLIKWWDVYDDDAQTVMFPTTPDRLSELPIPFRSQVLEAIMGDIKPENFQTAPTILN